LKRKIFYFLITLTLWSQWVGNSTATPLVTETQPWQNKVNAQVLEDSKNGEVEFLVILKDQAYLSQASRLGTKEEKGAFVFKTLSEFAEIHQKPVRAVLDRDGVDYKSFWVANMLWVRSNSDVIQKVASLEQVSRIDANPQIAFRAPEISSEPLSPMAVNGIEWNVSKIHAPDAWSHGYTGEGIVIGGQDTGYDWDHPALKDKYRGWDSGTATADHNYNWHDAITSGGGVCGPSSAEPCDDYGHGTHTMGTMVGDDGGSNQIGVAPGAKWIGCRNMNVGWGTPATYTECYEWFIAPTDLNDENPDPSQAPDVINNSWGCPEVEGCTTPDILLTVVQNVRAAGIVTVHSAGNGGSNCETISDPAAIYEESFTIGATNSGDNIASFSSRGPVTIDSSGRLKPDVVAPGVNIRSSVPGTGYESGWEGTSMAAPHVAGTIALLLSANPSLIGQVDEIEKIIETSAIPLTSGQTCGGVPGSTIPNNTYGWGRVDAWAAILKSFTLYLPLVFK
jgi:serine protease AprX